MRISLLLQREPLPTIVEETLSSFWSRRHGTPYTVCWREGRANSTNSSTPVQRWLVNAYLNTIAVRHASSAAFDPIRREFSRSLTWWKRPAQQLYVRLASTPHTAPLLAQATVEVSPAVPGATHKLVVAGNHKLRLLDHQEGRAYGILKAGFLPHFMQQELAVRQKASDCGLPVPQLLEVAEDGTWFSEAYLSGTPVNRLPDQSQVAAVQTAYHSLQALHDATAEPTTIEQYALGLRREIGELLHSLKLLTPDDCSRLTMLADALLEQVCTAPQRFITTVLCHGDFQPANILLNADGPWLIDWEYATRRQAAYDLLVYALSSRFPKGIASRLQAFVHNGLPATVPFSLDQLHRVLAGDSSGRCQQAALFLLEELHQHLCENSQPLFNRSGEGLRLLQTEISQWLQHVVQIGS